MVSYKSVTMRAAIFWWLQRIDVKLYAFKNCILLDKGLGQKNKTVYFMFYDKLETVAEMSKYETTII